MKNPTDAQLKKLRLLRRLRWPLFLCGLILVASIYYLLLRQQLPADKPQSDSSALITPVPATALPKPTPAPTPTPRAADTAEPAASPTPEATGLLKNRYAEKFTTYELLTADSYTSEACSVSWKTVHDTENFSKNVTYFVADTYVQDAAYITTAFAKETFSKGGTKTIEAISKKANAVIAVSGDFASWRDSGLVIRNGVVYRTRLDGARDVCVLYADGVMETYEAGSVPLDEILERNPWQAWCFGPALLDADGECKTSFHTSVAGKNPRAAIGYYEPGHYCFVVVDGRQGSYSQGMTMKELSQLMNALGCTAAFNLDGGATAQMTWNSQVINSPSGTGRDLNDIICISFYEQPLSVDKPGSFTPAPSAK